MAPAELDEKIAADVLKQVEFYFGDSNLPRDNFLKLKTEESSDGLVSLALICTFSKMRQYLRLGKIALEEIPEESVLAVAEVLRKSSLLQVSDDGKKVGRLTPLLKPEELIEQLNSRTIAVAPLEYDVGMENIRAYFSQYGKVNSVRLPRHVADHKFFGGTALVEFCTEEDAKAVLGQRLVYAGAELELVPKKDYDYERKKLIKQLRSSKDSFPKNDLGDDDWFPKGVIIAFQVKKLSSKIDENNGSTHQVDGGFVGKKYLGPTSAGKVDGDGDAVNLFKQGETDVSASENIEKQGETEIAAFENIEKQGETEVAASANMKKQGETEVAASENIEKQGETEVAAFEDIENEDGSGVGDIAPRDTITSSKEEETKNAATENVDNEDKNCVGDAAPRNEDVVKREDLKELFKKFGIVMYVDYHMGDESGYIRFEEPGGSQKARACAALADEGGLTVKGHLLILEPVTGDAERKYWSLVTIHEPKKISFRGSGSGRGRGRARGRGRGGRGRGRESYGKRERDNDGEAEEIPPEKKLKA